MSASELSAQLAERWPTLRFDAHVDDARDVWRLDVSTAAGPIGSVSFTSVELSEGVDVAAAIDKLVDRWAHEPKP